MSIGRRRLRNILRRLLNGEEFYTNLSPRISRVEIEEVEKTIGSLLQIEHTHGAQPGPIAVYPLHKDEFNEKARKFLDQESNQSRKEETPP